MTWVNSNTLASHTGDLYNLINATNTTVEKIVTDKIWDTKINSYWWECTINNMPRYDANGYTYVYFAVEKMNSTAGSNANYTYSCYYCNDTSATSGYRPTDPDHSTAYTSKDVFGIANSQLTGSVFILADGVHKNNTYSDYYSATAVNRVEGNRTVSGKKLWKFPLGIVMDESMLPSITVDLYRSTTEISVLNFKNQTSPSVAYRDYIIKNCEQVNVATASGTNHFTYSFTTDSKGGTLPKYNEWGQRYYYYTLEDTTTNVQNFPKESVSYADNDYNITNVYTTENPYVEVTVQKVWKISTELLEDIAASGAKYGLKDLTVAGLAPVTVSLNGTYLDKNKNEIADTEKLYNSVVLDPSKASTVISSGGTYVDKATGVTYTVSSVSGTTVVQAAYTFTTFTNDLTGEEENLPYYWINGCRIGYSLEESTVNGYLETAANTDPVQFNSSPETRSNGDKVYTTDTTTLPVFTNEYKDGESTVNTTKITFNKNWADAYVGNDAYRPDGVQLTIARRLQGTETKDESWKGQTLILLKTDFPNKITWSGEVDGLIAYDPLGRAYEYYIEKEEFLTKVDTNGTITYTVSTASASVAGQSIGNYTLKTSSAQQFTNQLKTEASVTVKKTWTLDGENVIAWENADLSGFSDLMKIGALPTKIQYIVQRITDGTNYETVPASDATDSAHTTTYGGKSVLGREVDLTSANSGNFTDILNAQCTWQHLPVATTGGSAYTYRVIEVLTWADGTTKELTPTDNQSRDIKATITSTTGTNTTSVAMTNNITTNKVRIAKIWDDQNGSQNTRPDSLTVTITPVSTNTTVTGRTLKLTTSGHPTTTTDGGKTTTVTDANVYYSGYFTVPAGVDMTYGVTGANYVIKESYTAKNGAIYTQTITSDGNNVKQLSDGTWVFQISNKWEVAKKTVDLEAYKAWAGSTDWDEIVKIADKISFKLQYWDRTTEEWTDAAGTNGCVISDLTAATALPAVQKVPVDDTSTTKNESKVSWNGLYKYWSDPEQDGVAQQIRYRVVEVIDNGKSSYTQSYDRAEFAFSEETTSAVDQTITNTLDCTTLAVTKSWTKTSGGSTSDLTNDEGMIDRLIALNAIPEKVTVVIQYQVAGTTTWTDIPNKDTSGNSLASREVAMSALIADGGYTLTGLDLPKVDKNGKTISYRVYEKSVTYKNGTTQNVAWDTNYTEGVTGSITATPSMAAADDSGTATTALTNDYAYVSKTITKQWQDENNRDGKRGDFSVTLKRDGTVYGTVEKLSTADADATVQDDNFVKVVKPTTGNTWTVTYDYLPKYQTDYTGSGNESVYTWEESVVPANSAYTATYDADGAARTTVTNLYVPQRGTISATKDWLKDTGWEEILRADSVKVKLQYSVDNGTTFQNITTNTLDGNGLYQAVGGSNDGVYTTSEVTQTISKETDHKSYTTVKWENLPVYVNTSADKNTKTLVKVQYKIVEEEESSQSYSYKNVTTGTPAKELANAVVTEVTDKTTTATTVNNELNSTTLVVTKSWTGNDGNTTKTLTADVINKLVDLKALPEYIEFTVEYSLDNGSNWNTIPVTVADYPDRDPDSGIVRIATKVLATGAQPTGFSLPEYAKDGSKIQYRVRETAVKYVGDNEKYININWDTGNTVGTLKSVKVQATQIAYDQNSKTYTATLTNEYAYTTATITKNWVDEDNRDGMRGDFSATLYRDGYQYEYGKFSTNEDAFVTINEAANTWTVTYKYLPMYKTGYFGTADSEKSVYTWWRESEVTPGYANVYTDNTAISVTTPETNAYQPVRGSVKVTKAWCGDYNDGFGTRLEEIYLKLEWSSDGTNWSDVTHKELQTVNGKTVDGKTVGGKQIYINASGNACYTTTTLGDNNWVTVKAADDGTWTFQWDNLSKYVIADGKTTDVIYRVVEGVKDTNGVITMIDNASNALLDYTTADEEEVTIGTDGSATQTTVENTLKTTALQVSKSWTKTSNGSTSDFTNDSGMMDKLIALKALPEYIEFTVEYKDGASWKTIPVKLDGYTKQGIVDIATINLATSAQNTGFSLPEYDKSGSKIQYRVRETAVKYKDATEYKPITWNGDNGTLDSISVKATQIVYDENSKTYTAALTNDYAYTSATITKTWVDEDNRDGKRGDFSFTLKRDGTCYGTAEELNTRDDLSNNFVKVVKPSTGNTWTITYDYLPRYRTGYTGTGSGESVYTWEEKTKDTDIYAKANTSAVPVTETQDAVETNAYEPIRGSVKVTKQWVGDYENAISTRPTEIYLKLQWSSDGTNWNESDVTQKALKEVNGKQVYINADGTYASGSACYTTTTLGTGNWVSVTAAADGTWTFQWDNLSKYVSTADGTKEVTYRVIEGVKTTNDTIMKIDDLAYSLPDYATEDEKPVKIESTDSQKPNETTVKNTLKASALTKLTVTKNWAKESTYASLVRPDSVTFTVEYKLANDTDTWHYFPSGISSSISDIIVDAEGVSTIIVSGEKTADSWSKTIEGLPYENGDGTAYQYRVTEAWITYTAADKTPAETTVVKVNADNNPYSTEKTAVEATATADGIIAKFEFTNTFDTGSVTVTKSWHDENNRDGGRPDEIKVQLYQATTETGSEPKAFGDPQPLNDANSWTCTWKDLPARTAGYTFTYTVKEVDEAGNAVEKTGDKYIGKSEIEYTVTYPEQAVSFNRDVATGKTADTASVTIINTEVPAKGSVSAYKTWEDAQDHYPTRPESITLKLQYSTDGGAENSWTDITQATTENKKLIDTVNEVAVYADDGVYTTTTLGDKNWVTVKAADDGKWTFLWENLPEKTKAGAYILYRVVEAEVTGYTTKYAPESLTLEKAKDKAFKIEVTNTLNTTALGLSKQWAGDTGRLTPTSATFHVEATVENVKDPIAVCDVTLPIDGKWETIIEDLPVEDAAGNKYTYKVTETAVVYEKNAAGIAVLGEYAGAYLQNVETVQQEDGTWVASAENILLTGSITVNKVWSDSNNSDGVRPQSVTVRLYRDDKEYDTAVLNAGNNWSATWDALPYFKDDGSGSPSAYYVTEDAVSSYKTTYNGASSCGKIDLTDTSAETVTITNKHSVGVRTGDSGNLGLWTTLMGLSLTLMSGSGFMLYRKRKEE